MSEKLIGNESVTPRVDRDYRENGLTIRQYFAAIAMSGILANPEFLKSYQDIDIHKASVKNADSLIAELNKEK